MNQFIRCDRIYTERGCIDGALQICDGKIKKIIGKDDLPSIPAGSLIDAQHLRVLPGIIEHHIHGFDGWSVFSCDEKELLALADSLCSVGITAFVPTSHYRRTVIENIQAIVSAKRHQKHGARILGIHMEGPFINPVTLGSISEDDTHAPDLHLIKQLYEASEQQILTVTLAPELEGNMEIIDWLVEHQINSCIGVTNATYEQCQEAIKRGAVLTQKTGNCMGQLHHREVGAIGAALLDQRLYNEINSDLAHCSKEFLELLYRMKGYERLLIVADNNRMSGMPIGTYQIPEEQGEYHVSTDGLLHLDDGTIDGSALTIMDGIRNWVEVLHIPLEEAIVMASLNPARICHVENQKGSIKEGKDADLVIIDDAYHPIMTMVKGTVAYEQEAGISYQNEKYRKMIIR